MAWINTVPEGESKPRHKLMKEISHPASADTDYLIPSFLAIIQGVDKISFTEVKNYIDLTGIQLAPFECELLVEMGSVYNSFLQKAQKPDCPNPALSEEEVAQNKMKSIKAHMAQLRKKRNG